MPSRDEINAFREAIGETSKNAQADMDRVFENLDWSNPYAIKDDLADAMLVVINAYGDAAAATAAQWMEDLTGQSAVLPNSYKREQIIPRVGWGMAKAFEGDPEQAQESLKQVVDELVASQGKKVVSWSADRHGVRYARVPSGSDTCKFCLMLASRGFVYGAAKKAGQVDRFHANCSCIIVPEDGNIPEGYDPDALYEDWKRQNSMKE